MFFMQIRGILSPITSKVVTHCFYGVLKCFYVSFKKNTKIFEKNRKMFGKNPKRVVFVFLVVS